MKKRILKILFLPTEGNDKEEILVVVNGQLFRCIMNPKALCEGRPNSRESCSQVIKGFFFAQPQVYFCVQIVVSALLHLLPHKRSKIADTACTQTRL